MTTFQTIDELNTYLSDNLTKLDIKQYIQKYHDILHQDMDLSFMDYFLFLCEHPNEIIVKHEKLIEFGIFDSTRSSNIKQRIDSIELEEGVDFTLLNVQQRGKSGAQTHIHYTLTPKSFKLCLMRSKKQIKYAKYYLFLEEGVDYQLQNVLQQLPSSASILAIILLHLKLSRYVSFDLKKYKSI